MAQIHKNKDLLTATLLIILQKIGAIMNPLLIFLCALAIAYVVLIICLMIDLPLWLTLLIHSGIIIYGCYHLALMIAPDFGGEEAIWILAVAISSGFVIFGYFFLKKT